MLRDYVPQRIVVPNMSSQSQEHVTDLQDIPRGKKSSLNWMKGRQERRRMARVVQLEQLSLSDVEGRKQKVTMFFEFIWQEVDD